MAGAGADFFELQDESRRGTRRLLAAFALAALFVVACFCALAALPFWLAGAEAPRPVLYGTALVVGTAILAVSAHRLWRLREGGEAVAELLGARRIEPGRCTDGERKLLNVVEEIAIASGVAVPPVYCLDREEGINALAAGYSPNEAVIVVTQAALDRLTRDELQGVMAHEFSHILNGDMALNVRAAAVTAGLMFFSTFGERLVFAGARNQAPLAALAGALMAYIGFPGALAADAVRAAIAREREFLADAASVQFTRNPDGIAGALDAIRALGTHTFVRAVHASELSHMFFAQAVSHWWSGFATHPGLAERIRRVHPRFVPEDYRARRGRMQRQREVAVLDGQGNLVKVLGGSALAAAVGKPTLADLSRAVGLLAAMPSDLASSLARPDGAASAVFALALDGEKPRRDLELAVLRAHRGSDAAAAAETAHARLSALPRALWFPVVEIALPILKAQPQPERTRMIDDLRAVIEADARVRLSELVLLIFVRQHLREGAGKPVPAHYRSVGEVADAARVALSLVGHAGGGAAAYANALAALGLERGEPLAPGALGYRQVCDALEKLRGLAPLAKPRLLKACIDCAAADGAFGVAEVELLRAVAATLDCPLPARVTQPSAS